MSTLHMLVTQDIVVGIKTSDTDIDWEAANTIYELFKQLGRQPDGTITTKEVMKHDRLIGYELSQRGIKKIYIENPELSIY